LDNVESWLLLKSLKGVGNKTLYKAFRHFGSVYDILTADKTALESIFGSKALQIHSKAFDKKLVDNTIFTTKRLGVEAISFEDEFYPKELFSLPDPPPVLFLKGDKSLLNRPSISIVGSRKATISALNMTKTVVSSLKNIVVSGGADGIDSKAHESAIENSIPTISVLGFGFSYAGRSIFNSILNKNGLLISEFLPNEKPTKFTFPMRNRIIASLSEYLLLMQASIKSGALISAYWAFKLNKKVYAYIGNPVEEFGGSFELIRDNIARGFINKDQLLKDLNFDDKSPKTPSNPLLDNLDKPCTFDELLLKTGYDEEKLTLELTMLELEGLVSKEGAYFVKNA